MIPIFDTRGKSGRRGHRGDRPRTIALATVGLLGIILVAVMLGRKQTTDRPTAPATAADNETQTSIQAANTASEGNRGEALSPPAAADSLFYSVQVASFNTLPRAMQFSERMERQRNIPMAVTPAMIGGRGVWYRVLAGRATTITDADAIRESLWTDGTIERGVGTVIRTPHTFELSVHTTVDSANAEIESLRARGIPAYAVGAPNGTQILFGAFERPEQARVAEAVLRLAGLSGTLTRRVGSTQ